MDSFARNSHHRPDLTHDEFERLKSALGNEEFRKLLREYVDELSDPERVRECQEEIVALERERGFDVRFVNPDPGYVMKLWTTTTANEKKVFINVCTSDVVSRPCRVAKLPHEWRIPHVIPKPREDLDKRGRRCVVYDIVFHPESLALVKRNASFRKIVEETAVESVEKHFGVQLNRDRVKYPRLAFKGMKKPTVIRTLLKSDGGDEVRPDGRGDSEVTFRAPGTAGLPSPLARTVQDLVDESEPPQLRVKTPKYSIKYRHYHDIQNYSTNAAIVSLATRPQELEVEVHLPSVMSVNEVVLDVKGNSLAVDSTGFVKYKLRLTLPYSVKCDDGRAKFDAETAKLIVTLPVEINPRPRVEPPGLNTSMENEEDLGENLDVESLVTRGTLPSTCDEVSVDSLLSLAELSLSDVTVELFDESTGIAVSSDGERISLEEKNSTFPTFTHRQDDDELVFVIEVDGVRRDSIKMEYLLSDTACHLQFESCASESHTVQHSMFWKFEEHCSLNTESTIVDVGDQNLVVIFCKAESGRGIWKTFSLGSSPFKECKSYEFDHVDRLVCQIEQLQNEITDETESSKLPFSFQVTEMSTECTTITFMPDDNEKISEDSNTTCRESVMTNDIVSKQYFASVNEGEILSNISSNDSTEINSKVEKTSSTGAILSTCPEDGFEELSTSLSSLNSNGSLGVSKEQETFLSNLKENLCECSKPVEILTKSRLRRKLGRIRAKSLTLDFPEQSGRSISESSDDMASPSFDLRLKGILKYPRRTRTVSEPTIDFSLSSPDFTAPDTDIPEESTEESGSDKKSVRFSEVVLRSIFRSNSSILGQKRKNQRKMRNKRRNTDWRSSESECSETEVVKGKGQKTGSKKSAKNTTTRQYVTNISKCGGSEAQIKRENFKQSASLQPTFANEVNPSISAVNFKSIRNGTTSDVKSNHHESPEGRCNKGVNAKSSRKTKREKQDWKHKNRGRANSQFNPASNLESEKTAPARNTCEEFVFKNNMMYELE